MKRYLLAAAIVLAGCDSLLTNPCADGYVLAGDRCIAIADDDDGSGGGGTNPVAPNPSIDTPPMTCPAPTVRCDGECVDLATDADNCGRCGNVCATGICTAGVCDGETAGHVVAIGHDYASYHLAMARVLGNAVSLGTSADVRVAWYQGTASAQSVVNAKGALTYAMGTMGRPWHTVALEGMPSEPQLVDIDVVVVAPQLVDDGAGTTWKPAMDWFLARGGVVVVLETAHGKSYRLAEDAGLFVVGAPIEVTDERAEVIDHVDAIALQVPSPYLAEGGSVAFPAAPAAAVATQTGETIAFHVTR